MRQGFTDKDFNFNFPAFTGALFLLLITFFNVPQVNKNSGKSSFEIELLCEVSDVFDASLLFIEDVVEEDIDKILFGNAVIYTYTKTELNFFTHFFKEETFRPNTSKNTFKSDLSPPFFVFGNIA